MAYPFCPDEISPTHALRHVNNLAVVADVFFLAQFLHHLEKQEVGEFGDMLLISDTILPQDGAKPPELSDDVIRVNTATHFSTTFTTLSLFFG